jgi:hypothetical protein
MGTLENRIPYTVNYRDGTPFAVGRSEPEAHDIAQHVANMLGASVWVCGGIGEAAEVLPETK